MIRLFTTLYDEKNPARREEYQGAINRNLGCKCISEIYIFYEGGVLPPDPDQKICVIPCNQRPFYKDFFYAVNQITADGDISVVANTDIYFDDNIQLLRHLDLNGKCLALSRWDILPSGAPVLFDRNDSQDVWVFRGPLKKIQGDFPLGTPRCDNRILYELQKAGYEVINPAFSVRAYHLHSRIRQEYSGENLEYCIDPPYAYLWPHNLWSLPRTVLYNLRYPDARLSWRFDRRKFERSLPVRAVKKVWCMTKKKLGGASPGKVF